MRRRRDCPAGGTAGARGSRCPEAADSRDFSCSPLAKPFGSGCACGQHLKGTFIFGFLLNIASCSAFLSCNTGHRGPPAHAHISVPITMLPLRRLPGQDPKLPPANQECPHSSGPASLGSGCPGPSSPWSRALLPTLLLPSPMPLQFALFPLCYENIIREGAGRDVEDVTPI